MRPRVFLVALLQALLVGVAVAPQLSARTFGEEYRLEVRIVDPIDPFRGAYVDLSYPGLQPPHDREVQERGSIYITLVQDGALWTAGEFRRTRPTDGPYLSCDDRDWRIRCGIESWFVPQDDARGLEAALRGRGAIATVRVDSFGHAAIVDLQPR